MTNISLRQLRYFEALAEHGHFGRAADACAISQPALSIQIKELEETLAAPLIERGNRTLRLTAFGQQVLERAAAILKSVDDLGDFARASKGQFAGRLRVGIIPTIAPYLLPSLVTQFSALYPETELSLRETLTQTLISEIESGQLDCAILALPLSLPGITEHPLFTEEFVLIRPEAEKDLPQPDREGLREMRLLLLEEGHCFRDQALSFCEMPKNRPRDLLDGSSLSTLVQMVGAGIGVTLIPEMAVPVEVNSAAVSVSRLKGRQPNRHIGMVWRKGSALSDQFETLAGQLDFTQSTKAKSP